MSEEAKAKVKRIVEEAWEEAWSKGNVDVLDELCTADFVRHVPPLPDIEGLEAVKQNIAEVRSAMPDLQITIDEMVVEGDRCAARWTFRGTHRGQTTHFPFPPTGKQVIFTGCTIKHLMGGKLVDEWEYGDMLGLLQQLGVIPPLGQAME